MLKKKKLPIKTSLPEYPSVQYTPKRERELLERRRKTKKRYA